jgi:hypothetical protein
MVSSEFLRRVALVRTDVSEEHGASFIRVTKIGFLRSVSRLLVAACVVPSSSETSFLTRATRRNNPEDTILHSHRRENLKSYVLLFACRLRTTEFVLLLNCGYVLQLNLDCLKMDGCRILEYSLLNYGIRKGAGYWEGSSHKGTLKPELNSELLIV